MLIGKKAPDFLCEAVVGGVTKKISLRDFAGKYKVLFFYPADFTFVCPTELHAFQDALEEFKKRDTVIFAASVDSIDSHKKWLEQPKEQGGIKGITYPILADVKKEIARTFDVLDESKGVACRGLFIIDKNDIIQALQINNLSFGRNIAEVIRLIDAIKFTEEHGEVCPANWIPGKKGLKPTHAGVVDYFHKN